MSVQPSEIRVNADAPPFGPFDTLVETQAMRRFVHLCLAAIAVSVAGLLTITVLLSRIAMGVCP